MAMALRAFRGVRITLRQRLHTLLPTVPSLMDARSLAEDIKGSKCLGNGNASGFNHKVIWNQTWCFAAAGVLTFSSLSLMDTASCSSIDEMQKENVNAPVHRRSKQKVVFVLGGPGSGKGTQCAKIVDRYGFTHLSAGDLLRDEIKSGSQYGTMIEKTIKEGKIVPSEVTVTLLQKAMRDSGNDKFLIDGFPRNEENRAAFETVTGIEPDFVIYFDCSEEEMEKRLLSRNQGRVDDNIDTIKKRFRVFIESSLPVIQHYERRGKVRKINANSDIEEIFQSLQPFFVPIIEKDLLTLTEELLQCIDSGNYDAYKKFCDPGTTSFQPEAEGHLVEGLGFHKFCLDSIKHKTESGTLLHSQIASPKVTLLGNVAALVTYTRLCQISTADGNSFVNSYNETQVWQCKRTPTGTFVWNVIHFHRSKCHSS